MIKERNLWKWIKDLPQDIGPTFYMQRIETTTHLGTPDVYYSVNGNQGWIELKSQSSIHDSQRRWIARAIRANIPVFLLWVAKDGDKMIGRLNANMDIVTEYFVYRPIDVYKILANKGYI